MSQPCAASSGTMALVSSKAMTTIASGFDARAAVTSEEKVV